MPKASLLYFTFHNPFIHVENNHIFRNLHFIGVPSVQCTNTETKPKDNPTVQNPTEHPNTEADDIKRGEYLVQILGCNDCHTPKIMTEKGPVPDPNRLLSGHPADEQLAPIADKGILKGYALFNMSLTAAESADCGAPTLLPTSPPTTPASPIGRSNSSARRCAKANGKAWMRTVC